MSEHTPGLWEVRHQADANLIAAAPDMLDALKAALPYFISGACPDIQAKMQAAIAKAEGTTQ